MKRRTPRAILLFSAALAALFFAFVFGRSPEAVAARADAGADGGPDAADASLGPAEPLDYAVLGPDGGVPLHEGRFKSPFAHPRFGPPARVRAGMLLTTVRDYDVEKGTFEADFYFTLTSEKPMPHMDPILTNGRTELKEVMADKPTFKMYRFVGAFSSPADVHDYPFDTQSLTIELEDDDNGIDQVQIVPDEEHTNLGIDFEVSGWETAFTRARVSTHNFPDRFDHDDLYYTRYHFTLGLRRYGTNAIFKVFVPAVAIVLVSLTGIFVPDDGRRTRWLVTAAMLVAAVVFHFAVRSSLPSTPYFTRADKLMLVVYLILALHMMASLLWFFFDPVRSARVLRVARLAGVPVTLLLLAYGVFQ